MDNRFPTIAKDDNAIEGTRELFGRLAIKFGRVGSHQYQRSVNWRSRDREREVGPRPPIHWLPDELLLEILMMNGREDPDFGITASHIDRRFRASALGYPLLWTNIQLEGPAAQAKARAFLHRSRNLPVDVYLRYFSQKDADVLLYVAQINDFRRLFKEIIAAAPRWRIVSFDIRDYDIMTYAARAIPHPLPLLEKIFLRCRTAPHTPTSDHVFYLFPEGPPPRLKHIDFDAVNARWERPFVRNLETIRLVRSVQCMPETVAQLFATLRACPQLKRLQLESLNSAASSGERFKRLTLAELDILIFWKVNPDVVSKILENVRCPSLRVLELQLTTSRRNMAVIQALGTTAFPLPNLHMLGLGAVDYPPDIVYTVLRRLHTLKAIRVIGGSLPHALLQGLSGKLDFDGTGNLTEWLCPQLESLQIKAATNITDNDVCRAVARRYRNRQTHRIRTVWLGGCPHISEEIIGKLEYYKASVQVVS
ncbi:hypothetical protein CALVIDRAFT_563165 [Calocera viscosa TUFC12733]|uniref:F-box domain-containing protein n=1 Tax=Calocera viscosa (strain TUFC12733) TaxID=1330018 RepID=A0A167N622_CALVF|nr:hypothetical protein CALVIDRAFT_563165 [Calocera viscosa TUFC12733]